MADGGSSGERIGVGHGMVGFDACRLHDPIRSGYLGNHDFLNVADSGQRVLFSGPPADDVEHFAQIDPTDQWLLLPKQTSHRRRGWLSVFEVSQNCPRIQDCSQ